MVVAAGAGSTRRAGVAAAVTAGDGARLWDVRTGQEKRVWTHGGFLVRRALFGPGARQVLTAGWDGTLRVWDAKGGALMARLQTVGAADGLSYDAASGLPSLISLEIHLPDHFPEKYLPAFLRAVENCKVKKTIAAGPTIKVSSVTAPAQTLPTETRG